MAKKKKQQRKKTEQPAKKKVDKGGFPWYFNHKPLLCLKLFAISFLIYALTLGHQFTQDDAIVITENEFTEKGISGIKELLTYDTFRGFFKVEGKDNLVEGGRYRPLTPIMFAIGIELFGENPFMFHLMNILWYGLTVVLMFILLLKMLSHTDLKEDYVYFVAFVTSMLFAIHPIHTEVVANVKGRDEIMTMLLCLGAMYFSLKAFDDKNRIMNWSLAGLLFFLGLLAKEMAVVFIPIVAVSFFVFRKMNIPTAFIQTVPYLLVFAAYLGLRTVIGIPLIGGEESGELMNNPFLGLNGNQKYATVFHTLGKYVQLLFLPHPLTHDYYPRAIAVKTFSDPTVALSVFLYLGMIIYGIWGVLKRNHVAYGIAFFLISLFLVSNIPVNIGVNMAERFLFIPSMGFCFAIAVLLYRLSEKVNGRKISTYKHFMPAMMVIAIIFAGFVYKTVTRSLDWKSNLSLFSADWNKYPDSAKVRNAIGGELSVRSQDEGTKGTAKEKEMLLESISHLNHAIKIHPTFKGPYLLRGNAYFYLENYDEAIKSYQQALQLDPAFADANENLSKALEMKKQSGLDDLEKKAIDASTRQDYTTAISLFRQLLEKQPKNPKYHFFLGNTLGASGDHASALQALLNAEKYNDDPDNVSRVIAAIANTYSQLGQTEKAKEYQDKLK